MGTKVVNMVMDRNYTVRSTLGHMITFQKGVETLVPQVMVRTCAEFGARRVDGEEAFDAPADDDGKPVQAVDPGQRLEDVRAAIEVVVEKNDVEDFTAGGSPKTQAVSREVGYKVDYTEVKKAWEQRNEDLMNEPQ